MIIVFGRRAYGRVEASGPSFVYTDFAHLWYLPLVPLGSHLILGKDGRGLLRSVPLGLHGMSVLAGYLRVWAVVGATACLFAALVATSEGATAALPWVVVGAGLGFVAIVAWTAQSLRESVAVQGKGLMSGTYRSALDPATQWAEIALDPTVFDRPFVEACLTLCRLEWSVAKGSSERSRLQVMHRRLAGKLATLPRPALAPPTG